MINEFVLNRFIKMIRFVNSNGRFLRHASSKNTYDYCQHVTKTGQKYDAGVGGLGGWGAGGNVRMTGLESHIGREAVLQKLLFIFTSILGLSLSRRC